MYSVLVLLCLVVAGTTAAPATDVVPLEKQQPTVIPIVSQSEELESNGTYKFSYETGNGIKREESSYTKVLPKLEGRSADSNEGGESDESNEIHVQEGSYSYTAPDGTLISVRYIADENGFRPIGDHIPQTVVAAAAAAGSSSEKSGRALEIADSEHSASEPKAAPALASRSAAASVAPENEKATAAPESAPVEPSEASTTAVASENDATTEKASEGSPSATEAASTTEATSTPTAASTANASSEATDAGEGSTAAEATTKAADASTVAASEESASSSGNASTTEPAATAAP